MLALVKNCDLTPDAEGFVTKEQVATAMRKIGISEGAIKGTTNANFDHLPEPKRINLFEMNTIRQKYGKKERNVKWDGEKIPTGAIEHFRSTGIRDKNIANNRVDHAKLNQFLGGRQKFTLLDTLEATNGFDVDSSSNDVNEEARRDFGSKNADCGRWDSLNLGPYIGQGNKPNMANMRKNKCFSNLYDSITTMHMEFGTPFGEDAILSRQEMSDLWLEGKYPAGFEARRAQALLKHNRRRAAESDLTSRLMA